MEKVEHSKEIADLMKQINGKLVTYRNPMHKGIIMDAILLCPPGGSQISVKPYGYTPEQVVKIYHNAGQTWQDISNVSRPSWCLASSLIDEDEASFLTKVANLEDEKGIYDHSVLEDEYFATGTPSCPYG